MTKFHNELCLICFSYAFAVGCELGSVVMTWNVCILGRSRGFPHSKSDLDLGKTELLMSKVNFAFCVGSLVEWVTGGGCFCFCFLKKFVQGLLSVLT
jgi:hypothetical protein